MTDSWGTEHYVFICGLYVTLSPVSHNGNPLDIKLTMKRETAHYWHSAEVLSNIYTDLFQWKCVPLQCTNGLYVWPRVVFAASIFLCNTTIRHGINMKTLNVDVIAFEIKIHVAKRLWLYVNFNSINSFSKHCFPSIDIAYGQIQWLDRVYLVVVVFYLWVDATSDRSWRAQSGW